MTKLAAALDVAPQAISQWRRAPVLRVMEIARITGVPCHELRPDAFPPDTPKPKPRSKRSPAPEQAAD